MDLTPLTRTLIEKIFAASERASVSALLLTEAGETLGLSDPAGAERIHLAILKLSQGNSMKLLDAIRLAQIDWRDLLMAADFGYDVQAHLHWAQNLIKREAP